MKMKQDTFFEEAATGERRERFRRSGIINRPDTTWKAWTADRIKAYASNPNEEALMVSDDVMQIRRRNPMYGAYWVHEFTEVG